MTTLQIGLANNDEGVHLVVLQRHADGSTTSLHAGRVLEGDSSLRISPVPEPGDVAALTNQPAPTVPATREAIEEAAQVFEAAAAHNRSKGRTILAHSQQSRADRIRKELDSAPAHQPAQEQAENIEADAYMFACDEMERWQKKRAKGGLEIGTEGSLVDGIGWLYAYIEKLEAAQQEPVAAPQQTEALRADAHRYRIWRDQMLAEDKQFLADVQDKLPAEVGVDRPPTAQEWDSVIDYAAQRAAQRKEKP